MWITSLITAAFVWTIAKLFVKNIRHEMTKNSYKFAAKQNKMKKQFLFVAGAAILFASSCGSKNEGQEQNQQKSIDSAVNAQVAAKADSMKKVNDSMVNAEAAAKAKEMEKENEKAGEKKHSNEHGGKKVVKESTPTPPPPPPPPPPAPGGLRGHSDQNQSTPKPGGGLRSHADQNIKK